MGTEVLLKNAIYTYDGKENLSWPFIDVMVNNEPKPCYFMGDDDTKKFGDYRVVSNDLKEAIDPAAEKKKIGLINFKTGDLLIPMENKAIKPITKDVLLVEKAIPGTPEVLATIEQKKDQAAVSGLVSTSATIKDAMYSMMGPEGRFIFNDQFNEATICGIDGTNLVNGEYYSFIGVNNDSLYLSSNVANSPIKVFSLSKREFATDANKSNDAIDVNNVGVDPAVVNNALASGEVAQTNEVQAEAPVVDNAVAPAPEAQAETTMPAVDAAAPVDAVPAVDPAVPVAEGVVPTDAASTVPAVEGAEAVTPAPVVDGSDVPVVEENAPVDAAPAVDPAAPVDAAMPAVDAAAPVDGVTPTDAVPSAEMDPQSGFDSFFGMGPETNNENPAENNEQFSPTDLSVGVDGNNNEAGAEEVKAETPEVTDGANDATPPVVDVAAELQSMNVSLDENANNSEENKEETNNEVKDESNEVNNEPLVPTVSAPESEEKESDKEETEEDSKDEKEESKEEDKGTDKEETEEDSKDSKEEEKDEKEEEKSEVEEPVIPALDLTKAAKSEEKEESKDEEESNGLVDLFNDKADKNYISPDEVSSTVDRDSKDDYYEDDYDRDYTSSSKVDDDMDYDDIDVHDSDSYYSSDVSSNNSFIEDVSKSMYKLVKKYEKLKSNNFHLKEQISALEAQKQSLIENGKRKDETIRGKDREIESLNRDKSSMQRENKALRRENSKIKREFNDYRESINGNQGLRDMFRMVNQVTGDKDYYDDDSYMRRVA